MAVNRKSTKSRILGLDSSRRRLNSSKTINEITYEQHRLVHAVQELGLKMLAQFAHDFRVHVRGERAVRIDAVEHPVRADVRGHDHDGVAEVHRTALAVGQPSVVEELQQGGTCRRLSASPSGTFPLARRGC